MEIKLQTKRKEFFIRTLLKWGEKNYVRFPWRAKANKWHALAAEIMLQRTKAEQVVPIYEWFVIKYPSPEEYLKDEHSDVFKTLGLPERERALKNLAQLFVDQPIPLDREELLKLPGVGAYIAAAFRSLHMGIKDTIIDSNVVRLYGRFWGFETNAETRRKKWFIQLAENMVPVDKHKDYNYALLDFTRAICKPRPECNVCPLQQECDFGKNVNNED